MERYGLFIGVNDYADYSDLPSLLFAEADAVTLAEFMKVHCQVKPKVLLGKNATRAHISTAIRMAGQGELFVFFFAGHGRHLGDHYHLFPHDSGSDNFDTLSLGELSRLWHTSFGHKNVLAILDACRSEGGQRGGGGLDEKSIHDIKAVSHGQRSVEIVYGCGQGQVSHEFEELGHGLLTHSLIASLEQHKVGLEARDWVDDAADWMSDWCFRNGKNVLQRAWWDGPSGKKGRLILIPGIKSQPDGNLSGPGSVRLIEEPKLGIETTPPSCSISIDGKSFGLSPLTIPLNAGNYHAKAEKVGFKPWSRMISFDGKGDATVEIELQEKPHPQEEEVKPIQQEIQKWVRDNDAEWTKEQWKDFVLELYDSGIASGFPKKHLVQCRDQEKKDWLAEKTRRLEEKERRRKEEQRQAKELRRIRLEEQEHHRKEQQRRAEELRRKHLEEEKLRKEEEQRRKKEEERRAIELHRIAGEKLWIQIKEAPTRRLCREYLSEFPDGRFNKKIQDVLCRLDDEQKWRRDNREKIIRPILPALKLISILVADTVILAAIILFLKLSNNPFSSLSYVQKTFLFIFFVEVTLLYIVLPWRAKRSYQLAERTFSIIGSGLFLLIPFILFTLLLTDFTTGLIIALCWGLILFLPALPLLRWIFVLFESLVAMSCITLFLSWRITSFWPVNSVNKILLFILFGEISLMCVGSLRKSDFAEESVKSIILIVFTFFPAILLAFFFKEWYQATIGLIASIIFGLFVTIIPFFGEEQSS